MRHRNRRHCGMRTRSFMKGAAMADRDPNNGIVARIAEGVAALPKAAWDACNASGNPFMSHDFLSALEDSGSVGPGTGWKALPIVINDADDRIAAALPEIGRAQVCTPVTNCQLVFRLLLGQK